MDTCRTCVTVAARDGEGDQPEQRLRRCSSQEVVMTNKLLAGIAACAALALVTGANATERHHKHRHAAGYGAYHGSVTAPERDFGPRPESPTTIQVPAQPAMQDCVHVLFPQCDRGQYR